MYATMFRKLLLPGYEKLVGRSTFGFLAEYERNQWKTPEQIAAIQWTKLQQLLRYCYEHVPYYRSQWDRLGLQPQDIRSMDVYRTLPVLTKTDIRAHHDDLLAVPFRGAALWKATGGSTGEPLRFAFSRESHERRVAVMMRGYGWAQADAGRRTLYLWGGDVGTVPWTKRLKGRAYNLAYNRKVLNSFHMRRDNLASYVGAINRYRPEVIVAYAGPLFTLARFIKESGRRCWPPRTIVTGAEALHAHQRAVIEEVFSSKVYNTYGCREFMLIAAECEERKCLHVNADHLVVEVAGDREPGEIVVTDLHNYAMPFIRYANGDLAVPSREHCACGRGLPLLHSIEGRKLDAIVTRNGRIVPGEFFPHMMKEIPGVERFQVVQNSLDELDIFIVSRRDFTETGLSFIGCEVKKVLGDGVRLRYHFVEDIPLTHSGKLRVTVSRIQA